MSADEALAHARHLAEHGVPIFLAKRHRDFPEGGAGGYVVPREWQRTEPDPAVLDAWRPGMAVCAVMGHTVDGVDVDPRNGGDRDAVPMPRSYGRQGTPSGGTHDLVAPLGVRTSHGVLAGVDVKAGDADGGGCGFLFLAPTERLSKTTGKVVAYEWEVPPDVADLAILGADGTGAALTALVEAGRRPVADLATDGTAYADLDPGRRAAADNYVETTLFDWRVRLAHAALWQEGERDDRDRGWEALARDWAWQIALLAAAPWSPLAPEEAGDVHDQGLPDALADDPKCRGKWRDGLIEKVVEERKVPAPPWALDPVFDETALLQHIRQAAHARTIGARGLLLAVLARLAVEVPVTTCLPPPPPARASLNLGVVLAGPSGSGKSSIYKVSRELLGLDGEAQRAIERVPGSGEGLIESYLGKPEDDGSGQKVRRLLPDPRRLFYVDEIAQLGALKDGRSGSTVAPTMRSMLTGGSVGNENAEAARRRHLPEDSYRTSLIAGVQPEASDILLNPTDAAVGTPQRFAWGDTVDPTIPDEPVEWPGPLPWQRPTAWPSEVAYPPHLSAWLRRQTLAAARGDAGEDDSLHAHARLTRLKVAFLLAVLHGDTAITDRWWNLSGVVADEWTRDAIAGCRRALGEAGARKDRAAGRSAGRRRVAEDDVVQEDRDNKFRITTNVLKRLQDAGEDGVKWSDLRAGQRSTDRPQVDRLVGTPDEPGPLVRDGRVRLEVVDVESRGESRGKTAVRVFRGETP